MSKQWHRYSKLGMDSEYRNVMARNLASNEVAKVNRLHVNNICVSQNVDISGIVVIDGTLDVCGHSQLCDVSLCNLDISGTLDVVGQTTLCDVSACNVDISQNLDVDGHSQLCDLSACNLNISQNLDVDGDLTVDASVNFTAGRIDLKNTQILSEGGSSGRIVIGGQDNIGIGVGALLANPNNDDNNIAIGRDTLRLYNTSTAGRNVIIGGSAGNKLNGNSHSNVMVGFNAGSDLSLNSTDNVFLGRQSGSRPSGGIDVDISNCVGVGFQTLFNVSNNFDCIAIGHAPTSTTGAQNEIVIGSNAVGKGSNTIMIGNTSSAGVFLNLAAIPNSDPSVAGQLFRDGTDLKISLG